MLTHVAKFSGKPFDIDMASSLEMHKQTKDFIEDKVHMASVSFPVDDFEDVSCDLRGSELEGLSTLPVATCLEEEVDSHLAITTCQVVAASDKDLALDLVEPHTVGLDPLIQSVQIPLQNFPILQQINTPTQFGVHEITEGALNPLIQIINKDTKQDAQCKKMHNEGKPNQNKTKQAQETEESENVPFWKHGNFGSIAHCVKGLVLKELSMQPVSGSGEDRCCFHELGCSKPMVSTEEGLHYCTVEHAATEFNCCLEPGVSYE
ncbi:hypothetical protein BTVI_44073 [Pitangus sulphuratus]|nr:hypothetical protein BTVI_44073 [Pitangus sulphuratus]